MNYYQELLNSYSKLKKRNLHLGEGSNADPEAEAKAKADFMAAQVLPTGTPTPERAADGKPVFWKKEKDPTHKDRPAKTNVIGPFGSRIVGAIDHKWEALSDTDRQTIVNWYSESENKPMGSGDTHEHHDPETDYSKIMAKDGVFQQEAAAWWGAGQDERPFTEHVPGLRNPRRSGNFGRVDQAYMRSLEKSVEGGVLTADEAVEAQGVYIQTCKLVSKIQRIERKEKDESGRPVQLTDDEYRELRELTPRLKYEGETSDTGQLIISLGEVDTETGDYAGPNLKIAYDKDLDEKASRFTQDMAESINKQVDIYNDQDKDSDNQIEEIDMKAAPARQMCSLGSEYTTREECEAAKDDKGNSGVWMKGWESIRGVAMEQVWVLNGLFDLYSQAEDEEMREFYMTEIDKVYKDLTDVDSAPGMGGIVDVFRGTGLEPGMAETLEALQSQADSGSVRSFIANHSGLAETDPGAAETAADEIAARLGEDEDGMQALALLIALNRYASQKIIGDTKPIGVRTLGQSQNAEEDSKRLGVKVDVGLIYNAEDAETTKTDIREHLGQYGVTVPDSCFQTVAASDAWGGATSPPLPPGYDASAPVMRFNAEVKTLTREGSKSTLGQTQGTNLVDKSLVGFNKGASTDQEVTYIRGIQREVFQGDFKEEKKGVQDTLQGVTDILADTTKPVADRRKMVYERLPRNLKRRFRKMAGMKNKNDRPTIDESKQASILKMLTAIDYIKENSNNPKGKAMGAYLVASIIGSQNNIARITFVMESNIGNVTTDDQNRTELVKGLKGGGWNVHVTDRGDWSVTDNNGNQRYSVELRGGTMVARKSTTGMANKEKYPNTFDLTATSIPESLMHKFLTGQAKLVEELLNHS